jgi:hypothetical protein
VKLTYSEKRILRAALREFDVTFHSDFHTLREYHTFLRDDDEQVDMSVLALKLQVALVGDDR